MLWLIYQAGYMAGDRQSRNRSAAKSIFSGGVFSDERPVSGHIRDTVTFRKSRGQRKSLRLQGL
jgi:hypothetical protein